MNIFQKNARTRAALGISEVQFKYYRVGCAHWEVLLADGGRFTVVTHNFGTESSVLKLAAEKLVKMGKQVAYPKGAA